MHNRTLVIEWVSEWVTTYIHTQPYAQSYISHWVSEWVSNHIHSHATICTIIHWQHKCWHTTYSYTQMCIIWLFSFLADLIWSASKTFRIFSRGYWTWRFRSLKTLQLKKVMISIIVSNKLDSYFYISIYNLQFQKNPILI